MISQLARKSIRQSSVAPRRRANGRCVQTLVLAREGILEPTFCSIEEYLGRNTIEYYAVLAEVGKGSYHPENDATPWIRFTLTAHYRQAATLVRRSRMLQRLWDQLEMGLRWSLLLPGSLHRFHLWYSGHVRHPPGTSRFLKRLEGGSGRHPPCRSLTVAGELSGSF
jgi:hypothetical protein